MKAELFLSAVLLGIPTAACAPQPLQTSEKSPIHEATITLDLPKSGWSRFETISQGYRYIDHPFEWSALEEINIRTVTLTSQDFNTTLKTKTENISGDEASYLKRVASELKVDPNLHSDLKLQSRGKNAETFVKNNPGTKVAEHILLLAVNGTGYRFIIDTTDFPGQKQTLQEILDSVIFTRS